MKPEGRPIAESSPQDRARHGLIFVPQEHNIFGALSITENLEMGAFADRSSARARPERSAAPQQYACDVTYGTNNEFGFDYLRDNMKYAASEMVQRGHRFAIVDEVDSILIDEARTPLIISGPLDDRSELYNTIDTFIPKLEKSTTSSTRRPASSP